MHAQTPGNGSQSKQFESRVDLERAAAQAEGQGRQSASWLLRSRLKAGDFQEGDRIVVVMEESGRNDTLQVRSGKTLHFAGMPELSLDGVLRSELEATVRHFLAKYLKYPQVRATPLLALAIVGSVRQPGYHYFAADALLRDVLMKAGGPGESADLSRIVIRRGSDVVWNPSDTRVAFADGLSIDALHLRAGDEVEVPVRRRMQWTTVVTAVSSVVALTAAVIQIQR